MTSWLFGLAIFMVHLLGILSAVLALLSSRTSQGAIAWILSLITLPYVAVPAYWIFGRPRFYGYVSARGERDTVLRRVLARYRQQIEPYIAEADSGEVRAVEQLAMMPLTVGNRPELLIDGQETFDSLFAGIEEAEEYVLIQFFIVRDDALGLQLKHHLDRAVGRGVRVYFLYDEIGSRKLGEGYLKDLHEAGVAVTPFNSSRGL